MASSVGGIPGMGDGTFCVPIIEPVMDVGFDGHSGNDNVDLVDL